jgi:tape measure domain-containing protein
MAKIQIEYTANVENLKTKLNELVKINETLSRSVFATKMALEDMSKATSQSTTKKALEDIKKASDGASKSAETAANSLKKAANTPPPRSNYKNWAKETESIIKQLFSNVLEYEKNVDARRQKFANDDVNRRRKTAKDVEKYDQETKRLWLAHLAEMDRAAAESQKRRLKLGEERVKAKQREAEAKKKADAEYVKWWEKELSRQEKEEAKKARQSVQTAERAARERAASEARSSKQREAEQKRLTRETEREERRRVVATQKAEAERVKASQSSTESMMKPLLALRGYVSAAFAVGSIVSFGEEVIKLLAKLELLESRLGFIYGGTGAGNAAFIRLSSSIKELGLEYEETLEQATSFSIAAQQAGYTTTQVEKMFISFASSLRAAGSSSLQVQRSFYALQQMMSKGVVSAEELNRQMGESLPGAAMLMFKAYKNLHPELVQNFEDFRKLQKEGKILSAEVLPEFIRVLEEEFGPALEGKKSSLSARLNRLSQAYTAFKASLLDTAPIKNATSALENMLNKMTALMSSKRLSFFEKLLGFSGGPSAEFIQLKAEVEANLKLEEANYIQTKVQEKNLALSKLTKEEQQERYNNLEKEIKAYKTYLELISKTPEGADFLDRYAITSPQVAPQLQRPETMAGFDITKRGYRDISKVELSIAEQLLRDLGVMISSEGAPTGDEDKESPRIKFLEQEILLLKAKIMAEEDAIKVINEKAEFEIKTTETLVSLKIKLSEAEEKVALLKASGAGETAIAMAKKESEVLQQQIELRQHEEQLMIDNLELQKMIIQQRLLLVKEGSIEEYKLREELLRKNQAIEILKAKENSELVKKITADTNAEIKKMYQGLANEVKDFMAEVRQLQEEPFMDEVSKQADEIIKKYDKAIQELRDKFQKNVLSSGGFTQFDITQTATTTSPMLAEPNILAGIADQAQVEKVKKATEELEKEISQLIIARDKALQKLREGDKESDFLGLSSDELEKLKKALNVAIDLFQDYYDARTEIAKNAIEKEQALLDKKLEAGLIRENEYNEETKKNKEEMAKLDRDAARFGVLINTAQAIVKLYTDFDAITATILAAGVVAVGATQLSAINSAPLPEFHEGGLDIKKNDNKKANRGLKSGEFYAKLLEGESVMTREETAKYKDVLKAIREDSLPSHIMKGYTAPAYHRSMDEPYRMAKEQTSLELAFQNAELVDAIRRNGAVAIKNPDEIADAIVSKSSYTKITNRRRIR